MKIVVVGATSAIAEPVLRLWARRGDSLHLLGRRASLLEAIAADLSVRGAAHVSWRAFDVARFDDHAAALADAWEKLGGAECLFVAHGTLPDQTRCEESVSETVAEMTVNGLATCALVAEGAMRFAKAGQGTIAVITSVAGERGRRSNYTYGASKAMVSTFLAGLRHRFQGSAIRVVDIRPGFIDTPMTARFRKGLLWARPEQIAGRIVRAIDRGAAVVYVPGFWRLIMLVIRALPEPIFVRLKL
jgi:short-subunit dehydrogenase